MSEMRQAHVEYIEAMFVQSAAGFSSGGGALTLHGTAPSTIYFADRPRWEVGHTTTHRFIGLWPEGDDSFAANPPHAVLSFADQDADVPADALVVLSEPILTGDVLTYKVRVLDGELPEKAGPCSVFIDAVGRRAAPVATCPAFVKRNPVR